MVSIPPIQKEMARFNWLNTDNTNKYCKYWKILNGLGLLPVQDSGSRPVKPIKANKQWNIVKYWKILKLVWFAQSNCLNIYFQLKENDLDNQLGHQTSGSPWNTVIKGQWDLSNSSVPDLFDLRAKTPPLSIETTDGWIHQHSVPMTWFAKEKHIQSEWALLQQPLYNEWCLIHCTHYGFHGNRPKTLKCYISASNWARDMRFSVFAFIIWALHGTMRWIPKQKMAKHLTHRLCKYPYCANCTFTYWQCILVACPLVHLPRIVPMFAKSFNIYN